jgi:YHS domain-containing protein
VALPLRFLLTKSKITGAGILDELQAVRLNEELSMLRSTLIKGFSLMAICAIGLTCGKKTVGPVPEDLQKQIASGESIFYQKDCGKCHLASNNNQEFKGPALTTVHLAEDTLFAKYRLYHFEPSEMPPIPLTHQEISALAQYIASLHAKAYTPANLTNVDARCPVCGAALEKAAAIKNSLETTHGGKFYYFECPDCKEIFLRDPHRYSRTGYARAGLK